MSVEAFKEQLAVIRAEYRRDLPARLARIDALWSNVAGGGAAQRTELQRELHSIAGSARTFGIAGVSEAAAAAESFLERIIKGRKAPPAAKRDEFARLLGALKQAAARDGP